MFLMSSWSVNSPAACLLIKATGHRGTVFVASEVQYSFKLFHTAFSALTAISLLCKWIKISLVDG